MGYAVILIDESGKDVSDHGAPDLEQAMRQYEQALAAMARSGGRRVVLIDRSSGQIMADSRQDRSAG